MCPFCVVLCVSSVSPLMYPLCHLSVYYVSTLCSLCVPSVTPLSSLCPFCVVSVFLLCLLCVPSVSSPSTHLSSLVFYFQTLKSFFDYKDGGNGDIAKRDTLCVREKTYVIKRHDDRQLIGFNGCKYLIVCRWAYVLLLPLFYYHCFTIIVYYHCSPIIVYYHCLLSLFTIISLYDLSFSLCPSGRTVCYCDT